VRKRIAWLISTGLIAGSLAIPGIAAAHTNEAIAETGGMELALLGSDLTVDIDLDEFGNLEMVDVFDATAPPSDPELLPDEGDEAPADPHRFRFEDEEDGTRVDVMAKKHKLTSTVKAAAFEDLLGTHTWEAALFPGAGGEGQEPGAEEAILGAPPTTVTFTVGGAEEAPTIEIIGIEGLPSDATSEFKPDDEDDEDAAVTIVFMWNGYTKILKIKIDVDDDGDEDGPTAVLRIELRAKDRQRLRAGIEEFVGDHTWTGLLCDGTLATVAYSIDETGVLGLGEVTFDPVDDGELPGYEAKEQHRGFWIRFDESKARLKVMFGETEDGQWDLKVDAKTTERCKHHDDETGERGNKERPERERNRDHDEKDDKRKDEADD
jgi:hypothetical protein